MAPRTKLTHALKAEVTAQLSSGATLEAAAAAAGVHRSTLHAWLAVGHRAEERAAEGELLSEREQRCLDLMVAADTAQAEHRIELHDSIVQAALKGDTKAAMWLLEKMWAEDRAAGRVYS